MIRAPNHSLSEIGCGYWWLGFLSGDLYRRFASGTNSNWGISVNICALGVGAPLCGGGRRGYPRVAGGAGHGKVWFLCGNIMSDKEFLFCSYWGGILVPCHLRK